MGVKSSRGRLNNSNRSRRGGFRRCPRALRARNRTASRVSHTRSPHDGLAHHAHLAARDRRAERELADRDLVVHDGVRKVVLATCHRADEDRDVVRLRQRGQVPREPDGLRVPGQRCPDPDRVSISIEGACGGGARGGEASTYSA